MQTEFPKLEEFLIGLQRSWEEATKTMEGAQEMMKRQFDKKEVEPTRIAKKEKMYGWRPRIFI